MIPSSGQLVTVRQRRYVVTDVIPSGLPGDALHANADELVADLRARS